MSTADSFVVMAKPVGPICNLDCGYCYYLGKTGLFPPGEHFRMSPQVLESYVSSFIASSPGPVVHFGWHGGEPTLAGIDFYRQVVELQDRYLPAGWRCLNNIQTNGTLLNARWCSFLAEHHFAVGLSIDGPANLHNASRPDRRGRPTHERAMRGLRLLRAAGIEPDVLCTLNALTAAHPTEVYRFFVDQNVQWVQFLPVVERAPGGGISQRSVTAEAMGEFLCTIFDEWVRHDVERIGVQNFLECFLVVTGKPANLCVMSRTCGRVLAMEHDGSVYSCDHYVDPAPRRGDERWACGTRRLVGADRLRRGEARLVAGVLSGVPCGLLVPRGLSEGPLHDRARRRSGSQLPLCRLPALLQPRAAIPTAHGDPRASGAADLRDQRGARGSRTRGPVAMADDRAQRLLPVRERPEVQAMLPVDPSAVTLARPRFVRPVQAS